MHWKKLPWWRILRILAAGIVLVALMGGTWFFPGYEKVFISQFGSSLLALTSAFSLGAFLAVASVAVMTLLAGRLYCSILCPLGILQDLMMFFKGSFAFQGTYRHIKYPFFFLVLGLACAGLMLPLAFLMPSANFVAIENNVFREVSVSNTLDHITPQEPDFTTYSDKFHNEYLDNIGNLSLLTWGNNASKKNHNPANDDVMEIYNSVFYSHKEIYETLKKEKQWCETQIEERKNRIVEFIKHNWLS